MFNSKALKNTLSTSSRTLAVIALVISSSIVNASDNSFGAIAVIGLAISATSSTTGKYQFEDTYLTASLNQTSFPDGDYGDGIGLTIGVPYKYNCCEIDTAFEVGFASFRTYTNTSPEFKLSEDGLAQYFLSRINYNITQSIVVNAKAGWSIVEIDTAFYSNGSATKSSITNYSFSYGAGIQYKHPKDFSLHIDYLKYTTNTSGINAGMTFHF